jgi:hypothetical protein
MTRTARLLLLAPALAAALLAAGCARKGIEDLGGEQLFSLSLGRLEDQIDLFQPEGMTLDSKNRIAMRDGLFYVANGNAGKIMTFTSYGDLLFLLYNAKTNPAPITLGPVTDTDAGGEAPAAGGEGDVPPTVSTRGAVSYPFTTIGEIAVASDKRIYVEDSVPRARAVRDAGRGILRDRVVLRFDRKGRPEGAIGQEGLGGEPFPYIHSLFVTARDALVVVCRVPDAWQAFWYSREGTLLYRTEIDGSHLPPPQAAGIIQSLVSVFPDQQEPVLHLLIHSYRQTVDASTRTQSSVEVVSSRVWRLDLRTQSYGSFIELPQSAPRREKVGLKTTEIPAPPGDLLGVSTAGNYYVLAFADSNLYRLQVIDAAGRVRAQRYLLIEDSELTYRDLRLAPTGIIYGLLADQTRVHVSWWRSDLVGEQR